MKSKTSAKPSHDFSLWNEEEPPNALQLLNMREEHPTIKNLLVTPWTELKKGTSPTCSCMPPSLSKHISGCLESDVRPDVDTLKSLIGPTKLECTYNDLLAKVAYCEIEAFQFLKQICPPFCFICKKDPSQLKNIPSKSNPFQELVKPTLINGAATGCWVPCPYMLKAAAEPSDLTSIDRNKSLSLILTVWDAIDYLLYYLSVKFPKAESVIVILTWEETLCKQALRACKEHMGKSLAIFEDCWTV